MRICAGSFVMGAVAGEPVDEYSRCEHPAHTVTISRDFFLGRNEVSVGQFRQFVESTGYVTEAEQLKVGANSLNLQTGAVQQLSETVWHEPGFPQTDDHPVVCVSWNDAHAFCGWLSQTNNATFRLPTEAEWEYACRAGTQTKYYTGSDPASLRGHANFRDAALQDVFQLAEAIAPWSDGSAFTSPVGRFSPNAFGLLDMHGNVGEWCQDWYSSAHYTVVSATDPTGPPQPTAWHAVKGGSWYNSAHSCRCSGRHDGIETAASTTNGFRVCRVSR
ncbi:MAG: formylglycine-generating enzyme family protein [Fuerstiella sp.]